MIKIIILIMAMICNRIMHKSYVIDDWKVEESNDFSTIITIFTYKKIESHFENILYIISFLLIKNYSAKIQINIILKSNNEEGIEFNLFNNIIMNKKELFILNDLLMERLCITYEKYKNTPMTPQELRIKFVWIKDIDYEYVNNKNSLEMFFKKRETRVLNLIKISIFKLLNAFKFYNEN